MKPRTCEDCGEARARALAGGVAVCETCLPAHVERIQGTLEEGLRELEAALRAHRTPESLAMAREAKALLPTVAALDAEREAQARERERERARVDKLRAEMRAGQRPRLALAELDAARRTR